jgi:hypothetical protein
MDLYIGAVVAVMDGGTVNNCYNTGSIDGCADVIRIGGIIGQTLSAATVSNCYNTAAISIRELPANEPVSEWGGIRGYWLGGIVGMGDGSSISQCYNTGELAAAYGVVVADIGGIAGSSSDDISSCYNTGAISPTDRLMKTSDGFFGGIVGTYFGALITNCYNIGDISSINAAGIDYRGGIAGGFEGSLGSSGIINCYSSGNIAVSVGGYGALIGGGALGRALSGRLVTGFAALMRSIYFNTETTDAHYRRSLIIGEGFGDILIENNIALNNILGGPFDDADSFSGSRIAPAEATLQSTYESLNWDFDTVWKMVPGYSYPQLQWQTAYTEGGHSSDADPSAADVASGITAIDEPSASAGSLKLPVMPEGFTVEIAGTDNPAVIGIQGNVYPGTADTLVKVSLRITKTSDGSTALTSEIAVLVRGSGALPVEPPPASGGNSNSGGGASSSITPAATPTPAPSQTPKPTATPGEPSAQAAQPEQTPAQSSTPSAVNGDFADIHGHWAENDILETIGAGLFNGVSDAQFDTEGAMTRAMLVTALWRLNGQPAAPGSASEGSGGEAAFSDVAPGQWYSDAVAWAASNGITLGYGSGNFGVGAYVTREQIAVFLLRYAKYSGADAGRRADILAFADAEAVSAWAVDAIAWAVDAGLIVGRDGNSLAPQASATRAEVSTILARYLRLQA